MEEENWAEIEFGAAELHDARRTARLIALGQRLGEHPSQSLPEACEDRAHLKAAYRFFGNKKIESSEILKSHVAATAMRVAEERLVLAVQDTTSLDYTAHPATTGLGVLNDVKHQGFLVHTTLAMTPERVPLGLLAQEVWTRDAADLGTRATRKQRPITKKESQKWLISLEAVKAAHARCPQTRFISVGDREADVYDFFLVARPPGVDLLVRASWDRRVEDAPQPHLWAAMEEAPEAGTLSITVPRKPGQPARTAHLSVRFQPVTLRPPRHRIAEHLPTVPIAAVLVREIAPPPDTKPVEWLLLTTCPVTTLDEACETVAHYACRWDIEVWHTVLKSGCRIEARQLETADRLRCCLTLYSVIAWRVLYATLLARAAPDLPCSVLLDRDEWQALSCIILRTPSPPSLPPTLRQAVRWVAQLGGFLARTSDGEPGPTTLWRGFQHLADHTTMFRLLRPHLSPQDVGND